MRTMNELVEVYGGPQASREGNGPAITSDTLTEWTQEKERKKDIALLLIRLGKPYQNKFIEQINRSLRNEVLDANLINSITEA